MPMKKKAPARKKAAPPRKAAAKASAAKPQTGKWGIRTAPKGDRFYEPEMTIRRFALRLPQASEDFPWGHRAFRVGKGKIFLFLAWDNGVFTVTTKLPQSQSMALTLPFSELTGYGMGKSGWVTARFQGRDDVPVGLLVQWIEESFRAIAPKKVAALLTGASTAP